MKTVGEVLFGTLALLWVVGIFTIQQLEKTADDFASALRTYFSLNPKGEMELVQLVANEHLPDKQLYKYVDFLIEKADRTDKGGLRRAKWFAKRHSWVKNIYEIYLAIMTILLPPILFYDFSNIVCLTWFSKEYVVSVIIAGFLFASLGARIYANHIYQDNAPLQKWFIKEK